MKVTNIRDIMADINFKRNLTALKYVYCIIVVIIVGKNPQSLVYMKGSQK